MRLSTTKNSQTTKGMKEFVLGS